MSEEPDNDLVICPRCVCQFRAISVNDQVRIAQLKAEWDHWRTVAESYEADRIEQRDRTQALTAERDDARIRASNLFEQKVQLEAERDRLREAVEAAARVVDVSAEAVTAGKTFTSASMRGRLFTLADRIRALALSPASQQQESET
ncbi:MAG: hypothetical protein JO051_06380 [Acidobacteriaceae bacterium]|nr:hypothetical protein [Acidobacteriaceae bacterium]